MRNTTGKTEIGIRIVSRIMMLSHCVINVAVIFLFLGSIGGCNDSDKKSNVKSEAKVHGREISKEASSPSGKYILRIRSESVDYDNNGSKWYYARLTILDSKGALLYEDDNDFATWFPLEVGWTQSDEVEVRSGDVGYFVYRRRGNSWAKERAN